MLGKNQLALLVFIMMGILLSAIEGYTLSNFPKFSYQNQATEAYMNDDEEIIGDAVTLEEIKTTYNVDGFLVYAGEEYEIFPKGFDNNDDDDMEEPLLEDIEVIEVKRIALTFDDGPHPKVTPMILDEFNKRGAKATFFLVGRRVEESSNIVYRMVNQGHEIGNHTWNHPRLTQLKEEEIQQQLLLTQEAIFKASGKTPTIMRPPYGSINNNVKAALFLPSILWSIDAKDWKYRNAEYISSYIIDNAYDGAIILLHDIYNSTAEAVGVILDALIESGYQLVTVSELLGLEEESPISTVVYENFVYQSLISF